MREFLSTHPVADLKKRIMRRVYAVWFWRSVAPLLAVEVILISGVAIGVLTHISVRNIMVNALASSHDIRAFLQFFVSNFFVKSIQSRLLFGAFAVVAAFFIRDLRMAVKRFSARAEDALGFLTLEGGRR